MIADGRQGLLQGVFGIIWSIIQTLMHTSEMNSRMRRIDLICKVLAPLLAALLDTVSTPVAILSVFMIAIGSLPTEYLLIAAVCVKSRVVI